jgi:hypothetical protein
MLGDYKGLQVRLHISVRESYSTPTIVQEEAHIAASTIFVPTLTSDVKSEASFHADPLPNVEEWISCFTPRITNIKLHQCAYLHRLHPA